MFRCQAYRVGREGGNLDALGGQLLVLQRQTSNLRGADRLRSNNPGLDMESERTYFH